MSPQDAVPCAAGDRWQPVRDTGQLRAGGRRVLVLSHMFPHPEQPGSGPFVHEQVQGLRQAGVDARAVVGRPYWVRTLHPLKMLRGLWNYRRALRAAQDRWWLVDGVPVRYLPYLVVAPFWSHAWSYRLAVRSNMQRLRDEFQPEIVHAHTGYLDGSAAQMLARAWGVPYLVTEHTGPFSTLMRRPVVQDTTLEAIRNADTLVSVSRALQKDVLGYLGDHRQLRTAVIPNAVDVDRFVVARGEPGDPDAPRLLFVGYFVPAKNLPLLLAAFAKVLAAKPRATLALVGGGENEAQTQAVRDDIAARGLQHAVSVRGFVAREEVARLMREECDMLVLQSKAETFGCVAAEALASGRPVVATRCGGPEDIVTEPWMGVLCDNDSPAALAEAILQVSERIGQVDPERLGASARERFGAASVARRLIQLYEDVLRRHPAGAARPAAGLHAGPGTP